MKIFSILKDLFKSVDCYCSCHLGPYHKNDIVKGGFQMVTCQHCLIKSEPKEKGTWGTAVPV